MARMADTAVPRSVLHSDVKSSRPKWPGGQNFGLGLA